MIAPWRAAGMEGWAAVKWLCYSVNLHSTRLARRNGFDSKELGLDNQVEGDESIMHLMNKNVFGRAKLLHWLDPKWNLFSRLEIEWTFKI